MAFPPLSAAARKTVSEVSESVKSSVSSGLNPHAQAFTPGAKAIPVDSPAKASLPVSQTTDTVVLSKPKSQAPAVSSDLPGGSASAPKTSPNATMSVSGNKPGKTKRDKPKKTNTKMSLADFQIKHEQPYHIRLAQREQSLTTKYGPGNRHQKALNLAQATAPHAGEVGTGYNPFPAFGHKPTKPSMESVDQAVQATEAAGQIGFKMSEHAEVRMMQDSSGRTVEKALKDVRQPGSSTSTIHYDPRPGKAPITITRQASGELDDRGVGVFTHGDTIVTTTAGTGQMSHPASRPIGHNAPDIQQQQNIDVFSASRQQLAQKFSTKAT